jgi:aryl-alcohol dehydrogenase-like predicted oxidoreductase
MELRNLGKTGAALFPVGLGAMQLSTGERPDEASAVATIHAALAAGIDFIDTANVYCATHDEIGHNERLIGKALRSCASGNSAIVATKGGVDKLQRRVNGNPSFLRKSCLESLKALGQESIFLYQLHAPDTDVPFEESVGELARLQYEGKIVHIGLCNVSASHITVAQKIVRIESIQNACHPYGAQEYQNETLSLCAQDEMTFFPHSVIAGKQHHSLVTQHPALVQLAMKYDVSPHEVVIAWHLAQSEWVVPIPGASQTKSAMSSASAAKLKLDASDLSIINAISAG